MSDLSNLTDEQRQLLAALLSEEESLPSDSSIPKRTYAHQAPLSSAQQRMWLAYRQSPNDASYNIQTALRVSGQLDISRLKQALRQLVDRHETLRTSFEIQNSEAVQIIHVSSEPTLCELEIRDPDALRQFISDEALRPWDLGYWQSLRATLISCSSNEYVLLLGMHHILSDGWSVGILYKELWQLYDNQVTARHSLLPELKIHYADYAQWEQAGQAQAEHAELSFWRSKLADADYEVALPLDKDRHDVANGHAAIYSWTLPAELTELVHRQAQSSRSSTFAVCLAGFYLMLAELTGQRDILLASPVANRDRAELEALIGYFANTVVLRAEWTSTTNFNDLVHQVHDYSLDVFEHQGFPFEQVVEDLNPRRMSGINPLTQIFFAFQKYALDETQVPGICISEYEHGTRSTRFDLECHVWETAQQGINATFIYPQFFENSTIIKWVMRWNDLLAQACVQPLEPVVRWTQMDRIGRSLVNIMDDYFPLEELVRAQASIQDARVHVMPHLTEIDYLIPEDLYSQESKLSVSPESPAQNLVPKQKSQIPALIAGDAISYESLPAQSLPELLVQAAMQAPLSGCLFLPDESHLSYLELLSRARKIQTLLQASGVQPGSKLIFQLDAEQDIIQYLWGAIFSGVVPVIQPIATLSQALAAEPVLAIWKLLEKPTVLVTSNTESYWNEQSAKCLNIELVDFEHLAEAAHPHPSQADDIALFAHSSGSTGNPKGIPLSHRNLIVRAYAARDFTKIDRSTVMLNWMPLNHHAPISDWHFRGVAAAANLIYANTSRILAQPTLWLDWLEHYQVTDTWAPNFAYSLIIETLEQELYAQRQWDLRKLKVCLCAGEPIVSDIMDKFEDLLGCSKLAIGVLQPAYGLTETASGISYHHPIPGTRITRYQIQGERYPLVGCGAPIDGVSIRVVNEQNELLQEEEVGYVHLHGACIFKGYFEAEGQNRERFKPDGWFDSGDLGFILDGQLFITGRAKAEIIVNGRNLSCEALEISIGALEYVRSARVAVCTVRPAGANKEQIAVFFVPVDTKVSPELLRNLRGHIVQQFGIFPDYLIPLDSDALARTELGKIRHNVLSKQFVEGAFDEILRSQTENSSTIPDSFYRREWQRTPLQQTQGKFLPIHLLSDRFDLANTLADILSVNGHRAQILKSYEQVPPDVVHLVDLSLFESTITSHEPQRPYVVMEHLRKLLQKLASASPKKCYLTVVTCQAQSTGREKQLRFDDAVVSGIIKSASQEFSDWLMCRHIDLGQGNNVELAQTLVEEIENNAFVREVVYRDHRRLTPRLKKVVLNKDSQHHKTIFETNGFVVVSGGLGGIGRELAMRLQRKYGLRLLLLGRSELNEEGMHFLSKNPDLAYAQVDVSDAQALQRIVLDFEKLWQVPLCGVVHLAGTGNWNEHINNLTSDRIVNLNAHSWDAQFKAKVDGTHHLFELVRTRPGARFVAASSVLGVFGGAGFSVYAAANSFLSAFCDAQYQMGHTRTNCMHWAPWQDVGMSRGQRPEQAMRAGYLSLDADAGWHIFVAGLLNNHHDLIVGLDPQHSNAGQAKAITVFYTTDQPDQAAKDLVALERRVRFNNSSTLEFRCVSEIPADLSSLLEEPVGDSVTPAQKEIEQKLCDIFGQALRLKKMPLNDNFFELGAHSLLLATLETRIKNEVSEQLELLDLFRFPTIRQLSRYLAGSNNAPKSSLVSQRRVQPDNRSELRQARSKHRKGLS
ncbi:MAG: SDR family NAD(P)-dependent oxidoreductase [Sheuella sp.]|nr:SDR family NAD(P)-dependent oxidoreductase [Sheuella sp.]